MSNCHSEDLDRRVPCEVFTRCVGYLRPVSAMHAGKRQEVADRVPFRVPERKEKPCNPTLKSE